MAKKPSAAKTVETIKHDADKRKNIPTGETMPSSQFTDEEGNLQLPEGARLFLGGPLTSDGAPTNPFSFTFEGQTLNHKPEPTLEDDTRRLNPRR